MGDIGEPKPDRRDVIWWCIIVTAVCSILLVALGMLPYIHP
jgi:hypothetical protein